MTTLIGKQEKKLSRQANTLHESRWIYGLYGALDGLSKSFSMLKYFFDAYYANSPLNSSDALHDWSLTSEGIAVMCVESIALITLSVMGNLYDEDDYYALHIMLPEDERLTSGNELPVNLLHFSNSYIWNGHDLVYIKPDGQPVSITFQDPVPFLKKIHEINPLSSNKVLGSLSSRQVKALITSNSEGHHTPCPPATTWLGRTVFLWPYFRDAIQALKNAYKGIKNAFLFFDLIFTGQNIQYLVMPVGILLGIISAFNRMWLRKIRDERKDTKKDNALLMDDIYKKSLALDNMLERVNQFQLRSWENALLLITNDDTRIRQILNKQYESETSFFGLYAYLSYVSATYNALLDAPYLYFGALSLTTLPVSSWFFLIVAAASVFFALTCVVTRIYEEYNFKRELQITQLEVELAMSVRQLKLLRGQLESIHHGSTHENGSHNQHNLQLEGQPPYSSDEKLGLLYGDLRVMLKIAEDLQMKLNELSVLSHASLVLCGLKNGLDAYSALASCMFAIATINLMILIPYSPLLVIGFVLTGMSGMLFFVALALISPSLPLPTNQKINASGSSTSMFEFFTDLKRLLSEHDNHLHSQARHLPTDETRRDIFVADPSPQFFFQEFFEVFRLFSSGAGKGIRAVESLLATLQELSQDGHYHDTDSMFVFAWIDAVVFAVIFALRGFARLGRDKIEDDVLVADTQTNSDTPPSLSLRDTDAVNRTIPAATRTPSPASPLPQLGVHLENLSTQQRTRSFLSLTTLEDTSKNACPVSDFFKPGLKKSKSCSSLDNASHSPCHVSRSLSNLSGSSSV